MTGREHEEAALPGEGMVERDTEGRKGRVWGMANEGRPHWHPGFYSCATGSRAPVR